MSISFLFNTQYLVPGTVVLLIQYVENIKTVLSQEHLMCGVAVGSRKSNCKPRVATTRGRPKICSSSKSASACGRHHKVPKAHSWTDAIHVHVHVVARNVTVWHYRECTLKSGGAHVFSFPP
jgi:hypothetical protein